MKTVLILFFFIYSVGTEAHIKRGYRQTKAPVPLKLGTPAGASSMCREPSLRRASLSASGLYRSRLDLTPMHLLW